MASELWIVVTRTESTDGKLYVRHARLIRNSVKSAAEDRQWEATPGFPWDEGNSQNGAVDWNDFIKMDNVNDYMKKIVNEALNKARPRYIPVKPSTAAHAKRFPRAYIESWLARACEILGRLIRLP